jgi:hypothetical protein
VGLVQRLIYISVTLAQNSQTNQPNTFNETGTDTVTLSGSRASVRIQDSGNPSTCTAEVKVWGMSPSLMNQLSTLGLVWNLMPKNLITIQAGDAVRGLSPVFSGQIMAGYGDYSQQPDVPFVFSCNLTAAFAAITVPPTSFPAPFDVATAMAGFARQMNAGFLNSGNVHITLPPGYYKGSVIEQIQKCAADANIYAKFPLVNSKGNTLEIWPKTGSRGTTTSIPVISAQNGMISYPAFTQNGIIVKTIFDPLISVGGRVKVESSLLSAIAVAQPGRPNIANPSGPSIPFPTQWVVTKLDLALDTMLPHGEWCSIVYAMNPGAPQALLQESANANG